jgi:TolB-like protein/tetratricopeptide (TPR) repeat protein
MATIGGAIPRFLSELKRRHVFRVGLAYVVVAWVIVQVSDTVFPRLQIPDAAVTFVIVLLILGLPLALVLAWAYDITPRGLERTGGERGSSAGGVHGGPMVVPATVGAGKASAVGGPSVRAAGGPIRTIVALPFANLTPGEDGDYLGDGITEELISAFGRVPGLRVVGRTSAFALKNRAEDIREMGARLGVDAAVEGSVRQSGRRVRVHVQLTDVHAGYQIWSQTYDRELDDVLVLQEEIARSLVSALQLGGTPRGGRLVGSSAVGIEAYGHYVRGRHFWNQRTGEALRRAIGSFEAAVAVEPSYGLAHAGLADCYSILLDHGLEDPARMLPLARRAAERAVSLEPELAETHTSLALVRQVACRWSEAEAGFRRAFELDPGYVVARHRYALLLAWLSRDAEAMAEMEQARELDPLSPIVATSAGWLHYWARRPDAAAVELSRVLADEPGFVNARVALGLVSLQQARPADAIAHLETAASLSGGSPGILPLLAMAYAAAGRRDAVEATRARVEAASASRYVSPYYLAVAALAAGERGEALALLARAAREHSPQLAYVGVEPLLDELRSQDEFQSLLEDAGLTDQPRPRK